MTTVASSYTVLTDGSVTSTPGFSAGSLVAGIKASGKRDLAILVSDVPCVAAGSFTQNSFAAAPVVVSKERIVSAKAQAIVVNSGNANACNGEGGLDDAREMTKLAAAKLGLADEAVLVASTGVIGHRLPMPIIAAGIEKVELTPDGGHDAALGIMTTDSHPKEIAVVTTIGGREVHIGGMGKGVGMIHPNMATLLAFVTTDAALSPEFASTAIKRAVDQSFNMISVDGDTSTNDSCFLLANGLAGNEPLTAGSPDAARFQEALEAVCIKLAKDMAGDGEGATKLIEVDVTGARTESDARKIAKLVVSSNLLKAAVHGEDPNWGRVFMAVGNAGAEVDPLKAALWVGDVQLVGNGVGLGTTKEEGSAQMKGDVVNFRVDLGLGTAAARGWGCDLTEQYVLENSSYTT